MTPGVPLCPSSLHQLWGRRNHSWYSSWADWSRGAARSRSTQHTLREGRGRAWVTPRRGREEGDQHKGADEQKRREAALTVLVRLGHDLPD